MDLLRDEKKTEAVKGDIEVSLNKIQKIIKEKSKGTDPSQRYSQ